ncbi:MAG: hypothetical protein M1831_005372, partial [Alyxoria varia]
INPQSLHLSADVPSIARREVYPEACRVFRDNRSGALLDDSEAPPLRTHIETRLLAGTRSVKGSPSGMGMMVRSVSGNFAFGYRVWPTERYQPTDRQTRLLVWPEEDKIMEEFIEMMFSKLPRLEIGGRPLEPPVEEGRETKHTRRPLKRPRPTDISPNKATKR